MATTNLSEHVIRALHNSVPSGEIAIESLKRIESFVRTKVAVKLHNAKQADLQILTLEFLQTVIELYEDSGEEEYVAEALANLMAASFLQPNTGDSLAGFVEILGNLSQDELNILAALEPSSDLFMEEIQLQRDRGIIRKIPNQPAERTVVYCEALSNTDIRFPDCMEDYFGILEGFSLVSRTEMPHHPFQQLGASLELPDEQLKIAIDDLFDFEHPMMIIGRSQRYLHLTRYGALFKSICLGGSGRMAS